MEAQVKLTDTNGQLLMKYYRKYINKTKANLTQEDNVTITNGGSITIASSTVTATADTADADNYLTFVGSEVLVLKELKWQVD